MKKIALFLTLVLCLGLMTPFTVSAAISVSYEVLKENPERTVGKDCYELLGNKSFEIQKSEQLPSDYSFSSPIGYKNTFFGCGFVEKSNDAHTGEVAVHIFPTEENFRVSFGPTSAISIIAGETYEYSIWMKRVKDGGQVRVDINFAGQLDGEKLSYGFVKIPFSDITVADGWQKRTGRFVAPENVKTCTPSVMTYGPADVLWDDVSLLCITDTMPVPEMPEEKPAIKEYEIKNAGFEADTPGEPLKLENGWEIIGPTKASDKYAHSGNNSCELRTVGGGPDAIATLYFPIDVKGATYQLDAWILNPEEERCDTGFWISYFSIDEVDWGRKDTHLGEDKSARWGIRPTHTWQKYIAEFTPPDDAKLAMIYIRHRTTPGVVYVDDVSLRMVKTPDALSLNTDETFYYTDWKEGYCIGTPYFMENPDAMRADFAFVELDGTETHQESVYGLAAGARYTFRTEWMKEKGERYHIRARVYNAENALVQEEEFPVFRYDRPTYLGADGLFRKNGDVIPIVYGTGLDPEQLAQHPEKGGVTVVQFYNIGKSSLGTAHQVMDKALEQGMYVMIICYSGGKSAGHPDMIDNVKNSVLANKDHPALWGYKIIDEPYQKGIEDEEMIAAYKTIRDLDPHHPIYVDDSVIGGYDWMFRYCDVLDIDLYTGNSAYSGTVFTEAFDMAMEASKGRKPFTFLQQASMYSGYIPSYDELRHQLYQAFFAGCSGYGYHVLGAEHAHLGEPAYLDREQWDLLCEKWAPWERDFLFGCFVTGTYKYVNYNRNDSVLWGTYTDGKDIYAICLNRKKTEETPISVPLSDGMGTMQIGSFTAQRMTGETATLTGNGTLSFVLAPQEAVVWKITPTDAPLNVSHLKASSFNDITYYPWAYNAIATLEEKGIVNRVSETWYGPGQNITRGDYAMFLVRTLGINVAPGENFVDVEADAEYAKELAIGKAAGIINGVGDNKFNPEAAITRQDMMTMTSRAMSLAGSADLSAFSDAGNIADYAALHVSAMVAEGLIKGNADGTINPLGNTTRAEAAVIMNRVLAK